MNTKMKIRFTAGLIAKVGGLVLASASAHGALVGHWEFDNPSDVGQATVGSHLQSVGNATHSASGKSGGALALGGFGAYLRVDANHSIPTGLPTGNASYTIAAFVKTSANARNAITRWGNNTTGQANGFRTTTVNEPAILDNSVGGIHNYGWSGDYDYGIGVGGTSPGTIYNGQWNHVAVTYDGTTRTKRLYFNGAEVGPGKVMTYGLNVAATNFRIGSAINTEFFNGLLDDVRIYDNALDGAQIAALIGNEPPTADPGPDQSIRAGNTVNLNGGASYDDNTASTALGYAWSFVSVPADSTASLASATTATPSFVADKAGTYVVGLVVTDEGELASPQSQVVISSANQAPTANAGADQMVVVFSTVSLNGSGSTDPDGDALTYAWTIAGPTGSTALLNGANTATPNFQPDVPGTYVMTLTASDFLGAGMPDTVEVTAITAAAYAELKIMSAANLIAGLGPNQVTTQGNQNALGNFLSQALKAVQRGDIAAAIFKLNEAIERTNGCEFNPGPSPDGSGAGRDWVTDCGVQPSILASLRDARDALTP